MRDKDEIPAPGPLATVGVVLFLVGAFTTATVIAGLLTN